MENGLLFVEGGGGLGVEPAARLVVPEKEGNSIVFCLLWFGEPGKLSLSTTIKELMYILRKKENFCLYFRNMYVEAFSNRRGQSKNS